MSKRRNTKKLRKQEYPDFDEPEYEETKSKQNEDLDEDSESFVKPCKAPISHRPGIYALGTVLTGPNKLPNADSDTITGTVVVSVAGTVVILDTRGYLHTLFEHEVYEEQK